MSKRVIWVISRPGYGDFNGLPEELWRTRALAQARVHELNSQFDFPKSWSKARRTPYKLRKMILQGAS